MTGSEGGVVFCGDDARLELFPTDAYGRAVPFRPKKTEQRYDGCLERARSCSRGKTADIVFAGVLFAICVVIIIILLIDR